jgi:hypothetical protein
MKTNLIQNGLLIVFLKNEVINMSDGINIVTVSNKVKLFKNGNQEEPASRIELIEFEENDFTVISEINRFEVGDKAVFIYPDYLLSEEKIFDEYVAPDGDNSKSKLGKHPIENRRCRVRAIKFNFGPLDKIGPTFSYGIALSTKDIYEHYGTNELNLEFLSEKLKITKIDIDSDSDSDKKSNPFPEGIYRTDETNFKNISRRLKFPRRYIGTLKIDGSSVTIGFINGKVFVGSRKEDLTSFIPEIKETYEAATKNISNLFIRLSGKYLDKLHQHNYDNILLRGELCGQGSYRKSSHNPHRNEKLGIKFFGVDKVIEGITVKLPHDEQLEIINNLGIESVPIIFDKEFETIEQVITECEKYFEANLVEGIVIKTPDNSISCKYINLVYDSKK